MKLWLHKIERIVDSTIPFFIVILLILILIEIFFNEAAEPYSAYIDWADRIIIGVFVIDLIFKYLRVRNIPKFFRHYWLDILAVFPFVLFFRIFQEALSAFALEEVLSRG
jgi:voltage-gated potassium channel